MKIITAVIASALALATAYGEEGKEPAPNKMLQQAVDLAEPESVGRHFLHALAIGNRKKAEGLMVPSKGFWNGVTEKDFPFGKEQSVPLLKAAHGDVKDAPNPLKDENMAHLEIGGIPLSLVRSKETQEWKVFTGYLFSTRHVNGITLPLAFKELEDEGK